MSDETSNDEDPERVAEPVGAGDGGRRGGSQALRPDAWSIVSEYRDGLGTWATVPEQSIRALVTAMGGDPDDDAGPPTATPAPAVPDTDEDGPLTCADPPSQRVWGLAVQVYAARSTTSWGIGDLADLRTVAAWARSRDAACVLINPIDAVAPVTPRETSPYTPTTRRFVDPVYLCVEEVPGAAEVDLEDIAERARARNEVRHIDRDAVWSDKQEALRRIWTQVPSVRDDPAFAAYRVERGDELRWFCAYLVAVQDHGHDTRDWPADLADPSAPSVAAYADRDEASFHAWQQFCLDRQLAAANDALPLLRDLPIGFDPAGFDAWQWRELLADGVTVGAPPDQLGPQGQDWQLPAFVPWQLARTDFAPLRTTYDAAMRNAGGLRIDHVLGLFRLFWIPPEGSAADGAYVRQDAETQLDVVAAASRDASAWVVGEDLGTVEPGVRPTLRERGMLRYQVLWFEPDRPEEWDDLALASLSTHDLPTAAGMWTGADADIVEAAGLERTDHWLDDLRARLSTATGVDRDAPVDEAVVALHEYIAAGPSRIVLGQLDDFLAVVERPNVPGTNRHQRADNWSLALPHPVDRLDDHPLAGRVAAALARP